MYLETIYVLRKDKGFVRAIDVGTVAERTYERHTVLSELFMKLGVDEENAVNDACKIEHVISSTTFAALKKHLNEDL